MDNPAWRCMNGPRVALKTSVQSSNTDNQTTGKLHTHILSLPGLNFCKIELWNFTRISKCFPLLGEMELEIK